MAPLAPLKVVTRDLEGALNWLRQHGFEVSPAATGGSRYRVGKLQCAAEIEPGAHGLPRIAAFPACLVAGEPALLLDRGYQKFFKTGKFEIAATAERLEQLHRFSEELKEALGYTSLYNEGLGSVSTSYQYDRLSGRDLAEAEQPNRHSQPK